MKLELITKYSKGNSKVSIEKSTGIYYVLIWDKGRFKHECYIDFDIASKRFSEIASKF